jgi:hypothetical protein
MVVVAMLRHPLAGGWQLINLLVACLSSSITYLVVLKSKQQPVRGQQRIALWMVVGMWALSFWFQLLSTTLQGYGVFTMNASDWVYFLLYSLAPFPFLLIYGWDGSFFALLPLTIFLFVADSIWEKPRSVPTSNA